MFGKRKCSRCNNKFSKKFKFCPHCGNINRVTDPREYGLLGENDSLNEADQFSNMFMNSFGGNLLGKMLVGTMKMLEKELEQEIKNNQNPPRQTIPSNMQLFINGKRVKIQPYEDKNKKIEKKKQPSKTLIRKYLSQESKDQSIKLPQEEPSVEVKRLSDSIIYELNVPEVKSINDISIVQLENSIEIKAVAKDKVYSKTMKISLPIIGYELDKGKLILELGV